MLTNQELFDKVVRHLVKQGKPSGYSYTDGSFICAYKTGAGDQCAAGCLLPESMTSLAQDENLDTTVLDELATPKWRQEVFYYNPTSVGAL